MTLAWCLTTLTKPNQHLHGPFATRERAQREAMRLLSHEAKLIASEALRMPPMLVPTPCRTTCRQPTAYVPQPAAPSSQGARRVSHTHVTTSTTANSARALSPAELQAMAIYRLTEGKLRYMAAQLGIPLGTTVTRASIIDILLKELDLA